MVALTGAVLARQIGHPDDPHADSGVAHLVSETQNNRRSWKHSDR